MDWLVGNWTHVGEVAGKAVLMYAAVLVGLRLGERRTLSQWTITDFATAVAMGAIVGRTAIAGSQSFVTGAVAVTVLIAIHRAASLLRYNRLVGKLADHRVRVLVAHGELRRRELRKCALTDNDLQSHLRQRGYFRIEDLRYVLYEAKGELTIVLEQQARTADPPLVQAALAEAAGYP